MKNKTTYEWDENKNLSNQAKHGIAFELVHILDWSDAVILNTTREGSEIRLKAIASISNNLYSLIFTIRVTSIRVISFRRASNIEIRIYNNG